MNKDDDTTVKRSAALKFLPSDLTYEEKTGPGVLESHQIRVLLHLLIPVFLLLTVCLRAQDLPMFFNQPLKFRHVLMEHGLPAPNVYIVHQDAAGFMWFGTMKGASRFDGLTLRTIDVGTVNKFLTDRRGRLWIAGIGLTCVDLSKDSMWTFLPNRRDTNALSSENVRALVEEPEGSIWVGHDGGLDFLNTETGKFTRLREVSLSSITSIADDNKGHLWIGSRTAIVRFDKKTRTLMRLPLDPKGAWVGVTVGPDGKVWVSSNFSFGLYTIDPVSLRLTEIREKGKLIDAVRVLFDNTGKVFVGTVVSGLKVFDPQTGLWITYSHSLKDPESIANNHVHAMYIDRTGNLWLGTANGVSWSSPWQKPFYHIRSNPDDPASPPPESIRSVTGDDYGNVWIGSWGGGLAKFDLRSGKFIRFTNPGPQIHATCSDHNGHLWISTSESAGLWRLTVRTGELLPARAFLKACDRLPRAAISARYIDRDQNLWLGIEGISVACIEHRTGAVRVFTLVRQIHSPTR
ncbi:MAG: hypothetical protein NTZ35_02640 [Ignavibacteriales bacterium]|nr:hypothetical protein [Ignavibacteriales bacterium]